MTASPGSVSRGRYTLTELGFARNKWPNPSNRVLQVMIAPTPLDQVPIYLKAVTILEPQGSAAAETRAAVERMVEARRGQSGDRPVLPFVVLSLASAILCFLTVNYAMNVLEYSFVTADAGAITILPGVIFGAAVAICNFIFGIKDKFQLALVIAITTAAWIAAHDASAVTLQTLAQYSKAIAADIGAGTVPATAARESLNNNPLMGYLVGCVGGTVGGAITVLGVVLTNAGFRRIDSVVVTWIAATAAGAIYGAIVQLPGALAWLLLFGVWQTTFVLTMARGFPRGTAQIPEWLARITVPALLGSRLAR